MGVLLSRMSFPGSYWSRHHRRVVQLRDTRCRRRGEYGGADRDDFLRSESGSCVSECVACVVTQKTVVGSQAHAPPPVLYTLAPRSACLSAYPALLWRTHHVRAIRGHGTWRSCIVLLTLHTHTEALCFLTLVVAFSSSCLVVTLPTLPVEKSGRETYSADDGGGYRGRRSAAVGAPHTSRGPLRLCGWERGEGSEGEGGACED